MKAALKFIMTAVGLLLIGLCLTTILLFTRFEGLLRDGLTHQAGRILHGEVRMEDIRFDWANQAIVFKGVSLLNSASSPIPRRREVQPRRLSDLRR